MGDFVWCLVFGGCPSPWGARDQAKDLSEGLQGAARPRMEKKKAGNSPPDVPPMRERKNNLLAFFALFDAFADFGSE